MERLAEEGEALSDEDDLEDEFEYDHAQTSENGPSGTTLEKDDVSDWETDDEDDVIINKHSKFEKANKPVCGRAPLAAGGVVPAFMLATRPLNNKSGAHFGLWRGNSPAPRIRSPGCSWPSLGGVFSASLALPIQNAVPPRIRSPGCSWPSLGGILSASLALPIQNVLAPRIRSPSCSWPSLGGIPSASLALPIQNALAPRIRSPGSSWASLGGILVRWGFLASKELYDASTSCPERVAGFTRLKYHSPPFLFVFG
ncbi:hypothetical protein C8R43DRAFT_1133989 [Mycena crocata]|nr:hypothetical protein C8R43DRAFT_1133989 [Mycena crocata]